MISTSQAATSPNSVNAASTSNEAEPFKRRPCPKAPAGRARPTWCLSENRRNFFSGNPNSQQQVHQIAQQKIQTAARQSPLLAEALKNTEGMLTGMLTSLGFQHVTVTFGQPPAS